MENTYIGLQGIAVGPIQLGPNGGWIRTSNQSSVDKTISVTANVEGSVFCKLQAGAPSSNDPHGVVTVDYFEKNKNTNSDGSTIDLGNYVEKPAFKILSDAVLGKDTLEYKNDISIDNRIYLLENQYLDIEQNVLNKIQNAQDSADRANQRCAINEHNILKLQNAVADMGSEVFKDPMILYAGNAQFVAEVV